MIKVKKDKKVVGRISIDPKKFDEILIKIGRKKQEVKNENLKFKE